MKSERICAVPDCRKKFKPVREIQLYCSKRCKNRAAARRLVKRAQAGRQFVNSREEEASARRDSSYWPKPQPNPEPDDEEGEAPLEKLLNAIADGKDLEEITE